MADKPKSNDADLIVGLRGASNAFATPKPEQTVEIEAKSLSESWKTQGGGACDAPESEFLWNVHSYTNEYIRFADAKAAMIIAYSSALIAGLLSARVHLFFLGVHLSSWPLEGWLTAFSLLALSLSIVFSGVVVRPRLRSIPKSGPIYWQNILAHQSGANYWTSIKGASAIDLSEQVALHIYDLSRVNSSKYRWIQLSIFATIVGSILCAYPVFSATYLRGSSLRPSEEIAPVKPSQVPPVTSPAE